MCIYNLYLLSLYHILVIMSLLLFIYRCLVSGAGKVAMHLLEKLHSYGAIPITISGKHQLLDCNLNS